MLSPVQLFATPWTIACRAPLSMQFSRQGYQSGFPCSPPGDLPDAEIEAVSLMSPRLTGKFFSISATWDAPNIRYLGFIFLVLQPLGS